MAEKREDLIPRPAVIRRELARAMREAKRLEELLKVATKAEEDQRFLAQQFDNQAAGLPEVSQ